ncbi:hypothetical protein EYF80_041380 [Liparis tanakae]|uniref:Uncharacterized protein n=1 Tax=Liparis tanakae TaxID=230148 RepID=A0A4Z2G6H8_9TELE|nr:hypothetical protein EYF80_041380 [Liparis tanakae]
MPTVRYSRMGTRSPMMPLHGGAALRKQSSAPLPAVHSIIMGCGTEVRPGVPSGYAPKGFQLQSVGVCSGGGEGCRLLLEVMVEASLTEEQFLWSSL